MIYYYKWSYIYELDIAVPKEKDMCAYGCDNKLHVGYEGGCLAEFLKEKFSSLSKGTKEERKLCFRDLSM